MFIQNLLFLLVATVLQEIDFMKANYNWDAQVDGEDALV